MIYIWVTVRLFFIKLGDVLVNQPFSREGQKASDSESSNTYDSDNNDIYSSEYWEWHYWQWQ